MNESEFRRGAIDFLEKIFIDLHQNEIEIPSHWEIDHICYRVESLDSYERMKAIFSHFGELLIESPVNGRAIATYKLNQPLVYKSWSIGLVELPAPKASKKTESGFEHIEVVCDVPFEVIQERYKHLTLDAKGLSKTINPELEIVLGKRNIKFHHQSLEKVIELERNT